ncbi:hypothetical protein [Leeuwenhoekiella marinoflava]|uniref:Outer membrane protein beta-barrel domain-containing protein n=3 Tax=Leeuwenhoekiella marinoflava TaxID=988 RepID=A0A4Q0PP49_9FLAO|nr:hypothetical protein [Leeuwenhoekiella marinoflava]RXG32320.1 hypothetical protein DSL99_1126 [Leeuwenhoekiella marinoflava]SHE79236.1 hypothetical protein SAMN02745246_01033 [Leeuwenhoekiella marinoflava DSM 3653]
MRFMTMNKLAILILLFLGISNLKAQTNALSNSPYSLFGVGIPNTFSTGKTNALGGAGIALKSDNSLNSLNPASLGAMPVKHFYFDIGYKAQLFSLSEGAGSSNQSNSTFSNVALAFPVTQQSAVSLVLAPYSNVGYDITGIEQSIEGSTSFYTSDVTGNGSLNELDLNYGYSFFNKLRLGITGTYLFGKTEQTEYNTILDYFLDIQRENRYTGFRVGAGFQYDITDKISIGSNVKIPTSLEATQNSIVSQDYDDDITEETSVKNFELPLEMGFGTEFKFGESYAVYADYTRKLWSKTEQESSFNDYKDQDSFKTGLTFIPKPGGIYYWQNVEFRVGANYDTGYLNIAGNDVSSYSVNVGLGLPVSRSGSKLNLMYSYGKNGETSNGLIQENIHSLSINFSLDGIWFMKPKYN